MVSFIPSQCGKTNKKMRKYMLSGAHGKAMKVIGKVAKLDGDGTKVLGYESDSIPSWDEALQLWGKDSKLHGKSSKRANTTSSRILASNNRMLLRRLLVQILVPCLALFVLSKMKILGSSALASLKVR
mmetsp:Transcript_960/g.1868  ORF Transcript_960/g.1868 Transcript_960/m.1868 type:complete len:128 (-) Transcript_960:78-461(-)